MFRCGVSNTNTTLRQVFWTKRLEPQFLNVSGFGHKIEPIDFNELDESLSSIEASTSPGKK